MRYCCATIEFEYPDRPDALVPLIVDQVFGFRVVFNFTHAGTERSIKPNKNRTSGSWIVELSISRCHPILI